MDSTLTDTSAKARRWNIIIVVVLHFVGIIGLSSPWSEIFVHLTPLHLVMMAALLYRANSDRSNPFVLFTTLTLMLTFVVEMIGVSTGHIFGSYTYGEVLGPKLFGTPVIIGVNWFLLACSAGSVIDKMAAPKAVKVVLAAAALTLIDVLIEPVAIDLTFWSWENTAVPMQNYVGWFLTGILVMTLYYYLPFKRENYLARWMLGAQIAFFASLNLTAYFNG